MNTPKPTPRKFCFISNAEESYLIDYLNLSRNDLCKDFSFEKFDLNALIEYAPDIIVVDQYFTKKDYSKITEVVQSAFSNTKIYVLSPEYSDYRGVMQSLNNKYHYYSNFCVDILNHINSYLNGGRNYLEAG